MTSDKRQPEPSEAADLRHEADMLDSMAVNRRNMHTTALRLREIADAIDRPRLTVTQDMVERVAKAMCDFDGPKPIGYTDWDALARVALAAAL